jgi:hypothetical protein
MAFGYEHVNETDNAAGGGEVSQNGRDVEVVD